MALKVIINLWEWTCVLNLEQLLKIWITNCDRNRSLSVKIWKELVLYIYRPRTKYKGRYCFHRCLSVHLSGGTPSSWQGEVPHSRSRWGYPIQSTGVPIPGPGRGFHIQLMGVPHPRSRQGVPHPADRGTPSQVQVEGVSWVTPRSRPGMGYLHLGLDGVPFPIQGWMGYPSPVRRQSSIASTCYMAGGMPLAFTQEDFLVLPVFSAQLIIFGLLKM